MKSHENFKVCPEDLPDSPDFQLLCKDGCYLFHPEDELMARVNKEKVKLIPKLRVSVIDLSELVRSLEFELHETFENSQKLARQNTRLEERLLKTQKELNSQLDWQDMALAIGGGIFVGSALTFVLTLKM